MNEINLLLIGFGYFPHIINADKNFFYNLVQRLVTRINRVIIFSVNDQDEYVSFQRGENSDIRIYNYRRPLHILSSTLQRNKLRSNNKIKYYSHFHPPVHDAIEKTISLMHATPRIKYLVHKYRINLIHFMDNCGPAMSLFARLMYPITISCAAPCYDPKGRLYDFYLRTCFNKMDIVIAYTQAYKSKLLQLAVNHPHIYAIPWGTPVPTKPISCLNKMALRAKYGIRNNAKLMIWSGFIQQIKEDDFFKSVCVAREISRLKEVDFIFAIKPEDCKERYMRESSKNVKVLTHIKEFAKLLESADILFSPVGAERSIVTPPLTWIEAMMLGVPILTTRIEGINEVIIDGKTGFIAESYKSLLDKSIRILEMSNLESISHNAQIFARDKYDIEKIADHLVSVWNKEILL